MQNPNRDSTTTTTNKSPSSSPDHPPPPPPGLPDDVLAAAEGGSGGGGPDAGVAIVHSQVVDISGGGSGGGDGSFALVAGGSSVLAMPAAEKRGKKKRKPSQLTDVPAGTPTCPVCGKEFPSWKSAFGHMRAHPKREYRGFFKPPAFSTSSSSSPLPMAPPIHDQVAGENINIDGASSNIITRVGFDLNQPMDERDQAEAAANKNSETTDNEDQKTIGFDLNQLPPSEDDDKDKHKH